MKSKHIKAITALFIVAILGIVLIMYHAYIEAVDSTKEKFSIHHSMLAKQLGLVINHDNQELVKELEFLSHLKPVQEMDIKNSQNIIKELYKHELQQYSVNDIGLIDSNGIIRFTLNANALIGKDFSFREYYQKARMLKTNTPIYEYIEFRGADIGKKGILIAMPVFLHEKRFNGLILFTVDAYELVEQLIPAEMNSNTIWIFDSSGNIIYHPEYPPGTNVAALADENGSFRGFLEEIRGQDRLQAEYILPEEGTVLASSHTISMAGESWTIVVSMPVKSFSGVITHSSMEYVFGIILIALTATGFILLVLSYNKALKKSHHELELRVKKRTADLTQAKTIADEEKAKSEAIIACMGEGISIQSTDFRIMYQNEIHKNIIGSHAGKYCYEAYQGKNKICEGCPLAMAFEDGGIHSSERSTVRGGNIVHVDITASPLRNTNGEIIGGIEIVRDITKRKETANRLKEAYSHLETLIEAMPYAVFFKDADGRHVVANETCCKFSGHTKEEFLGKTVEQLLPPDLAAHCRKSDEEIMRGGKTIHVDEQITDADGNKLFIETIKSPLFDDNGNVIGLLGMFHDITWRKRTEEELIKSRNLLSMLNKARELYILKSSREEVFAKLLDAIVSFTESEYGFINEVLVDGNGERYMQTLALSNISWDDASRRLYEQVKNRDFEFRNINRLQGTPITTGKPVISNDRANDPRSCDLPKGHPPINSFMGIPMYFGGELVGVAGVANRTGGYNEQIANVLEPFISSCASIITAFRNEEVKKFLYEEALRSSQLASVGELAAGVAHEINNPINGIINYAQILLNRSAQDGNRDIASRIIKEGDRISSIVKSLLSFARPEEDIRLDVSVGELLQEVFSLTQTQLQKEGIILETSIPPELPAVKVNRQQMEQVFLNIINNSQYALNQKYPGADPDKILTITARKYEHVGLPHVRVTISDKGTGIPIQLINMVTTTFFTTKPKGKGTGLGLSICQKIINDHGGILSIESKEGEFTTVNIDIPSADIAEMDKNRTKKRKRTG